MNIVKEGITGNNVAVINVSFLNSCVILIVYLLKKKILYYYHNHYYYYILVKS